MNQTTGCDPQFENHWPTLHSWTIWAHFLFTNLSSMCVPIWKKKVFDFWLNFILVNHNISVTMSSLCDPNYNKLFWCLSVVKYCKNINKMHCCTYCAILNSNSTKLKCPKLLNKPCVFCPSNLICFINRTNQLRVENKPLLTNVNQMWK